MLYRPHYIKKSNGVTLLELLLVLAVIAAAMFMTVRYFVIARTNYKVVQTIDRINTLVDASYKWVEGQPNFCGSPTSGCASPSPNAISLQRLNDAGLISSGDMIDPWNGKTDITVFQFNSGKNVAIGFPPLDCSGKIYQALLAKLKSRAVTISCSSYNYLYFVF